MNKKVLGWLAAAVIVVGVGVGVAMKLGKGGGPKGGDKKPEVALVFTPTEAVTPTMASVANIIEFSGPLVAPQTAIVRAKAAGTLLSLNVAEGVRVKAGSVLGRIDTTDMDNRLAERQAMLESAKAQLAQAQRNHASNQKLADEKYISPNALEASRVALDAAQSQVRAAQAQLGSVGAAAKLAALVAPIDGIVAKRHVVAGEKLSPEQQVLTIVDLRRLELAALVGTHEVGMLKVGMPLEVKVEGVSAPIKATLARIAPAAEAGTRSIAVAVAIDNAQESLRAGMYGMARANIADPTMRLMVPLTALSAVSGQDFVWVLNQGVLSRRAVTTGVRDAANGRIEILKGLEKDATVIAMRFDNLREGQKASVGGPGTVSTATATVPAAAPSAVAAPASSTAR